MRARACTRPKPAAFGLSCGRTVTGAASPRVRVGTSAAMARAWRAQCGAREKTRNAQMRKKRSARENAYQIAFKNVTKNDSTAPR